MKRKCKIGKIISDIITLICITVIVWFCGSVIEIGEHNTEKGYEYNVHNVVYIWLQAMEN